MRVGFDVTPLSGRGSGVARYTLELLRALRDDAPTVHLELLSNRLPADPDVASELAREKYLNAPRLPSRAAWMQAVLPIALRRRHLDLCHFTNFDAPLVGRTAQVVTLHDMSLIVAPELHPARRVHMLRPLMRRAARRADAVVCPTESAMHEATRLLDLDPAKVHVVAGAVAPKFRVLEDDALVEAARRRYGLDRGYVLFVGTIEPRKNIVRLARAFARLRTEGFDRQLVICGAWGWKSDDLRPEIDRLGIADRVVFTDYVADDDLVALINGAGVFVYPSLYEGFGLPIIEAFACGVPVVTSDRGAMAEVANGAALLVDPTDEQELADAIARAVSDDAERTRLRAAGLARATTFNRAQRRAPGSGRV